MRNATALCFILALATAAFAHPPAREMADAANNFLAALDSAQKAKACYEFADEERFDWHFIPKPRKGLPLKEMNSAQRSLAHALLSSGLSQRGFAKAATIMSLDQILFDIESKTPRPNAPTRDPELYYFTIFGHPDSGIWGWRVEGHHLSLNFVANKGEVLAATPSFFGTNPARVLDGPRKGLRVLGQEEDLGRALVKSFNESQRKSAIVTNKAPSDIITGHDRQAKLLQPLGISNGDLSAAQKDQLWTLLKEYLFRYRPEMAESELALLQTPQLELHFAWAGGLEPGEGHYYRIQGKSFIIEYDDTQNDANHIHTVWRDLSHDFGEDPLRQHYETVPHSK